MLFSPPSFSLVCVYGCETSHQRAFLVETMGRNCGYLALMTGIAGGAEAIVIPEVETNPELIAAELRGAYDRGKAHAIVVVAEGAEYNAERLARDFKEHRERLGFDLRVTILGHIQRGGAPGVFDRLLATRFGAAATDRLARGEHGVLVGLIKGEITATPLEEVVTNRKRLEPSLFELARAPAKQWTMPQTLCLVAHLFAGKSIATTGQFQYPLAIPSSPARRVDTSLPQTAKPGVRVRPTRPARLASIELRIPRPVGGASQVKQEVFSSRQLRRIMRSTVRRVDVLEAWAFGATDSKAGRFVD